MREEVTLARDDDHFCTVGQGSVYHIVRAGNFATRHTACGKIAGPRAETRTVDGAHMCSQCRANAEKWYRNRVTVEVIRTPEEQAEHDDMMRKDAEMRKKAQHTAELDRIRDAFWRLAGSDVSLVVEALQSSTHGITVNSIRVVALNLISAADLRALGEKER